MIIDVKGSKSNDDAGEAPSRQKYLQKELKSSSAPFAIGAALAGVALYLESVLPGLGQSRRGDEPVPAPQEEQPPGLRIVESAHMQTRIEEPEIDELARPAGGSAPPPGAGSQTAYALVDSTALRFPALKPGQPTLSPGRELPGANDNLFPRSPSLEFAGPGLVPGGAGDGPARPQKPPHTPDEENPDDEELAQNRAPRSTSHVILPDAFGCLAVSIMAQDLLTHMVDPDGDALTIRNVTVSSGALAEIEGGWSFQPNGLGPVTVRYEITDGQHVITQVAYFTVAPAAPIIGSEAADVLAGSACDDIIEGRGGDDVISGNAGDDTLRGGAGNDVIFGGAGNDVMFGGAGDDLLFGGDGDDLMSGDEGDDALYGEAGDDTIWGGDGNDIIDGGAGDDVLSGGSGDDVVLGQEGNDTIFGDSGNDVLHAGAGADLVFGGDGDDVIAGDAGDDVLYGEAGDDAIWGGEGNDIADGGDGDDRISGGAGDDILRDGAGRDIVSGDDGDDRIVAAEDGHDDQFAGGDGVDTIDYSAATAAVTIDLVANKAYGVTIGEDTITGFEKAIGGSGDDHFIVGAQAMILEGGAGENIFEFSTLSDDLFGLAPRLHQIIDFKAGDLIKMDKYKIFEKVADRLEDEFEAVYGEDSDDDEASVRFRYDSNDTKTIIEADMDRDDIYEIRVILDGHRALVIVEDV